MASLFRSEEMALYQLILHSDTSYECISKLGEIGAVQFRDLNVHVNTFQRKFIDEIRRCDEIERKLRYFTMEMRKDAIPIANHCKESVKIAPNKCEMNELEMRIDGIEMELRTVNVKAKELKCNFLKLTELKHILRKIHEFNDKSDDDGDGDDDDVENCNNDTGNTNSNRKMDKTESTPPFGLCAGIITHDRLPSLERMLCRTLHGHNLYYHQTMFIHPMEDCETGAFVNSSVFIAFYHGDEIQMRIEKICAGFHTILHPFPVASRDRKKLAINLMKQIIDLNVVMQQTQVYRHRLLTAIATNLANWSIQVCKIKAIFHTINKFDANTMKNFLIAECWIPVRDIEMVQTVLKHAAETAAQSQPIVNRIQTLDTPPTYFITNKFTKPFQILIESYGVANYREMNPAPYTIVTIPFLFAVMFGDFGHGLLMVLFTLWMILREKSLGMQQNANNEIWNLFFDGRYIILLMGLFSMYTGLIYNDFFSKSLNLFGDSKWQINYNASTIIENEYLVLDPKDDHQWHNRGIYPIGVDPIWQLAGNNKILFQNSFKMKMSIIFGVLHMAFGMLIRFYNYCQRTDKWSMITTVFMPQMIFLMVLFGYLAALMFIKWIKFSANNPIPYDSQCAPSILLTFINMVLLKSPPSQPMPSNSIDAIPMPVCSPYMFDGQFEMQRLFILIAMVCVPWMAFAKPLHMLLCRMRAHRIDRKRIENGDTETGSSTTTTAIPNPFTNVDVDHETDMTEVFTHSGIQTIEFVLGSISHTASYLRLWALSLAHAHLSEMLWNLVLCQAGHINNHYIAGIFLAIIFALWCTLTIGILILMEGLSAFLHTLRLHWVEFSSKFYSGQGYAFQPLSLHTICESLEAN